MRETRGGPHYDTQHPFTFTDLSLGFGSKEYRREALMSEKTARTHTHLSRRSKLRDNLPAKVVFKSVLDNPFRVQWPSVPINVQNSFLACLISTVDGVPAYIRDRDNRNRKRKRSEEEDANQPDPAPSILRHLTIGINQVTKRLESHIKSSRKVVVVPDKTSPASNECRSAIKLVFVCRADVDPPLLIEHLPHLVAACNTPNIPPSSHASQNFIKLVPLPKGSEASLAEALGLRRVAVMAIDIDAPELSIFGPFLDSVQTLCAPWLTPQDQVLIPTHIKQVRTSAPQDMKAAKEQRARGKLSAKERKKMKKKDDSGK